MTVGNMERAELFDAGSKGRGLRATRDLNTGEVIFSEPSFAAVVFDRYGSPGGSGFGLHEHVSGVLHRVGVSNRLRAATLFPDLQILTTSAARRLTRCHVNQSVTVFTPPNRIMRTL